MAFNLLFGVSIIETNDQSLLVHSINQAFNLPFNVSFTETEYVTYDIIEEIYK